MTMPRSDSEHRARLAAWMPLVLLGGCLVTSSEDIETSRIHAAIVAESSVGSAIDVAVDLHEGDAGGTGIALGDGDQLKARVGDTTRVLDGALSTYSVQFSDVDAAADTRVQVMLERASQVSALDTVLTLPEPFEIVSPPDTQTALSRGSDLVVTWSPAGTARHMRVSLTGECIEAFAREIAADPGTLTIGPLDIHTRSGQADVTCEVSLKVSRLGDGTVDPAFASGSVATALQSRYRWFDLLP